jgi:hypothetical protein
MTEPRNEPEPTTEDLERVRRLLAGAPSPAMPPEVAARLDAALAAESRRRTQTAQVKDGFRPGTTTGTGLVAGLADRSEAAPEPRTSRWRRAAAVGLATAVTVASVGVAGYTLSAAAGLNEPATSSILRLQSADLAREAEAIASSRNLSAHLFSGAWRCARDVTDGRITGLAPVFVDGTPAMLVYTRTRGQDWVTVVTGCPGPNALARNSVQLP